MLDVLRDVVKKEFGEYAYPYAGRGKRNKYEIRRKAVSQREGRPSYFGIEIIGCSDESWNDALVDARKRREARDAESE